MSQPIISIRNISKRYLLGESIRHDTLRDRLADTAKRFFRRPTPSNSSSDTKSNPAEFWALKDVSFDIQPGEVVGIIGRNGAGKSTLLKILSQITEPTEGEIRVRGRIASLLEVGTGFHPELTGRENVFLNGAILGMTQAEIRKKFDEIVAFAEIEKFLDTPVKRYSSGMYVRLAFAVAAHLDPEILIVDEVLAVGDASFQKKCLGKMENVAKQDGRTILFVSHNMVAVRSLCNTAILLNKGTISFHGDVTECISKYMNFAQECRTENHWSPPPPLAEAHGVRPLRLWIVPPNTSNPLDTNCDFDICCEIDNLRSTRKLNLSLVLYTDDDICVLNSCSESMEYPVGRVMFKCKFPKQLLNSGRYRVRILIVSEAKPLFDDHSCLTFEIADATVRDGWYDRYVGVIHPELQWEMIKLSN